MRSALRTASISRYSAITVSTLLLLLSTSLSYAVDLKRELPFDIPPQKLTTALLEFSRQAHIQVVVGPEVGDRATHGVKGTFAVDAALARLLEASSLVYTVVGGASITVGETQTRGPDSGSDVAANQLKRPSLLNRFRLAQANPGATSDSPAAAGDSAAEQRRVVLEEIIVTGSHIRGAAPAGSPLLIIDRSEIDRSGFANAPQLLQSLPQNFIGGASEQAAAQVGSRNGNDLNFGKGAGVNLRGLGNDSTLVLLNGQRMAASGVGDFVDLSLLPLAAMERVEVLTDGASAVYGSDAVGGVVNFVLRDDYEGAETRVRYGGVTRGSSDEVQASQLFGRRWNSGNALVSYEFYERDRLDAAERDFVSPALTNGGTIPSDLLPQQSRQSLLANLGQDVGGRARMFATAYASRRDTENQVYNPLSIRRAEFDIDATQLGGVLGASMDVGESWQAELVANYSRNRTTASQVSNGVPVPGAVRSESAAWSVDGKADGRLFSIAGGDVRVAVGAQYRREDLSIEQPTSLSEPARHVSAAFGEVSVPLVGADSRRPWVRRLDLTAAARYEKYSDFGDTTNPHVGVLWSVVDGLDLRGSWGTSFRAPLLYEKDLTQLTAVLRSLPDPGSATGTSTILTVLGAAVPDLGPEEATTWTAGLDIRPRAVRGLGIQLTWFDIDFRERIGKIDAGAGLAGLASPESFASLISRPASPELVALATSLPPGFATGTFVNLAGIPASEAQVSIDNRLRNLSATRVEGLDLNVRYDLDTSLGRWSFNLNSNHFFSFDNYVTSTSPVNEVLNTVYNPVDWRLRGGVGWNDGGWAITTFLNYTDSYKNNIGAAPARPDVASWTTADLQLSYNFGQSSGGVLGRGVVCSLTALNVFDRDPPRIVDQGSFGDTGYDSQNANPIGRFVALQIAKTWGYR